MPCILVHIYRCFAATNCLYIQDLRRSKQVSMPLPPIEVTEELRRINVSNCIASLLRQQLLWRNRRPEYGRMSLAVRFNRNVISPALHCTGDSQLKLRLPQILPD